MDDAETAEVLYARSRQHGDLWCPPQDAEHALLLQRAANMGCVEAQRDLGCCYATGEEAIKQNLDLARYWYGLAATVGHADAQYNYGCMILYGEGGVKEPEVGLNWVERAASQGDPCAKSLLKESSEAGEV